MICIYLCYDNYKNNNKNRRGKNNDHEEKNKPFL